MRVGVFERYVGLVLTVCLAMACALPADGQAGQQTPEAFVAELYGPRLQAARLTRDLGDDLTLAKAMFDDAAAVSGSPAIQRLLYQYVTELAVGSIAAADLAERALKQLDSLDPVETPETPEAAKPDAAATDAPALVRARRRVELYERQVKAAGPAETVKLTDRHLLALMDAGDAAVDAFQPREALRYYNAAKLLASRILGLDRSPIDVRMRVAQESSRVEAQLLSLEKSLERKPTAAGAAALARIHLTEGRNVAKALRYATHAEDEALVTNLKRLEKPMGELSPDEAAELADWLSAEANDTSERGRMYLLSKATEAIEHWLASDTANDRRRLAMQHKLTNLQSKLPSLPRLGVPTFEPIGSDSVIWTGRAVRVPGDQRARTAQIAAALATAEPGQSVAGRPFEEAIVSSSDLLTAEAGESLIFAAQVLSPKAQKVTVNGYGLYYRSWEVHHGRDVIRREGLEITLHEGLNVIGLYQYRRGYPTRLNLRLVGEGLEVRMPTWATGPTALTGVTWRQARAGSSQRVNTGLRIGPFDSSEEGLARVQRYLNGDTEALKGVSIRPTSFEERTPIAEGKAEVAVMAVRCDKPTTLNSSVSWGRGCRAVVNGVPVLGSSPTLRAGVNTIVYALDETGGSMYSTTKQSLGGWYTSAAGDVAVWPGQ